MVRVNSYTRVSKGKKISVSSHNRSVSERGDYNIKRTRQLPLRKRKTLLVDAQIKALKPGKRISKSGETYYERRFNRSDQDEYL